MASMGPTKLEEEPSPQSKGARFTVESWEEMYETGTVRNGGGVSKNE